MLLTYETPDSALHEAAQHYARIILDSDLYAQIGAIEQWGNVIRDDKYIHREYVTFLSAVKTLDLPGYRDTREDLLHTHRVSYAMLEDAIAVEVARLREKVTA